MSQCDCLFEVIIISNIVCCIKSCSKSNFFFQSLFHFVSLFTILLRMLGMLSSMWTKLMTVLIKL